MVELSTVEELREKHRLFWAEALRLWEESPDTYLIQKLPLLETKRTYALNLPKLYSDIRHKLGMQPIASVCEPVCYDAINRQVQTLRRNSRCLCHDNCLIDWAAYSSTNDRVCNENQLCTSIAKSPYIPLYQRVMYDTLSEVEKASYHRSISQAMNDIQNIKFKHSTSDELRHSCV